MSSEMPASTEQLDGELEHRQVPQAQDVHLEEPELLDGVHLVLRDDIVVVGALQRGVIHERLAADDDGRRMHPGLAAESLELARGVQHAFGVGLGIRRTCGARRPP